MLRRFLGDPKNSKEYFESISPIRQVSAIKVPVFVAHGSEDLIADVSQSKRLIAELKQHNIPFEKQIEADEGHGFHQLDHQVELYNAIESFLAKNLAPRSQSTAQ